MWAGTFTQEGRERESFSTLLSAILHSLLVAAAGMWVGHLRRQEERESSSTSFSTSLSAIFGFMAGSTQADYIVNFWLLQREHLRRKAERGSHFLPPYLSSFIPFWSLQWVCGRDIYAGRKRESHLQLHFLLRYLPSLDLWQVATRQITLSTSGCCSGNIYAGRQREGVIFYLVICHLAFPSGRCSGYVGGTITQAGRERVHFLLRYLPSLDLWQVAPRQAEIQLRYLPSSDVLCLLLVALAGMRAGTFTHQHRHLSVDVCVCMAGTNSTYLIVANYMYS